MQQRRRVLVIDDDLAINHSLVFVLNEEGFEVVSAFDGEEGLEKVGKLDPDVILLDIMMPKMDGFQVCEDVKSNPATMGIPVIMLTAVTDRDNMIKGLKCGATDFVKKPFDIPELVARVRSNANLRWLQRSLEEKQREIEKDLEMARIFQRSLLPSKFPEGRGLKFNAHYLPSAKVGGDLYDIIDIDEKHLGILMADLSGHGVHAAILVSMLKALMSAHARDFRSPGQAIGILNNMLADIMPEATYATIFYAVIDLADKSMVYTIAGHPPPLIYRKGDNKTEFLSGGNFFVGMNKGEEFKEEKFSLDSGDRLFLYTDGLIELFNPAGETFGTKRLFKIFGDNINLPITGLNSLIFEEMDKFREGVPISDDVAMLMMEVE